MTQINYIKGDATKPSIKGNKIIAHICNDIGGWGRGFVLALSKKWPEVEKAYREWFKTKKDFMLGSVQFIHVEKDIWIANILGQHGIYKDKSNNPPIRYDAVLSGLDKVYDFSVKNNSSVHMPRIGCGLAGGNWLNIEPLIIKSLLEKNIFVFVYDL